jgi:hypothetical protein
LPGWIPVTTSAGAANGYSRAERSAWLGLFTGRSESRTTGTSRSKRIRSHAGPALRFPLSPCAGARLTSGEIAGDASHVAAYGTSYSSSS